MRKALLFGLMLLLLIGSVNADWCYQEFSNETTACGGPGYTIISGNITNVSYITLASTSGCTPETCEVRCEGNSLCIV